MLSAAAGGAGVAGGGRLLNSTLSACNTVCCDIPLKGCHCAHCIYVFFFSTRSAAAEGVAGAGGGRRSHFLKTHTSICYCRSIPFLSRLSKNDSRHFHRCTSLLAFYGIPQSRLFLLFIREIQYAFTYTDATIGRRGGRGAQKKGDPPGVHS